MAKKKKGARMILATMNKTSAWKRIQIIPTKNSIGFCKMAKMFICIPIAAINTYKNTVATLDAPAPSYSLARVKDKQIPSKVVITINQKNLDVKLNVDNSGACSWMV